MNTRSIFLFLISLFCCFLTKCEEQNNIDKEENVKSTTYFCRPLVDCIEKVFSCFNTFDISIRATRISNIYPFFWEKDGALTVRLSFFKIFKNNPFS